MSQEPSNTVHDGVHPAGAPGAEAPAESAFPTPAARAPLAVVPYPDAFDDEGSDADDGEDDAADASAEDDAATLAPESADTETPDGMPAPAATTGAPPLLSEVLLAVEELWPESLAEDWDRVGLVVGRPEAPVGKVMFAVDPTLEVVEEALAWGASLLITHHPLLLKGVNSVAATGSKGRVIHRLIEGGCALLTVHTNGDSAVGGVSDVLADALGIVEALPLMPATHGLPEEGIGRVGQLPQALTLGELAAKVFLTLPAVAGGVRVAGDRDALVRTVAVCGGSGDSLLDAVRDSAADVFVTADLRHHPASEARESSIEGRPYLIDLSHFASEWLWLPAAAKALGTVLLDQGYTAQVAVSQTNTDPWDFILTPSH